MNNALWCITAHHDTINNRAKHRAGVTPLSTFWSRYAGFNEYRRKRKAIPKLVSSSLKIHADMLLGLVGKPYMSTPLWSAWAQEVQLLAECLSSYSSFLDEERTQQAMRQSLDHPVRQVRTFRGIHFVTRSKNSMRLCSTLVQFKNLNRIRIHLESSKFA